MLVDTTKAADHISAGLTVRPETDAAIQTGGVFHIQCFDKDGNLKWEDSSHNLVVNEGLQSMNTQYFKGSAYTAAFYLGLVTGPSGSVVFAAGNTLASHSGWTEFTAYSGARKSLSFGTASTANPSVISSSAPAQFVITGSGGVVSGAFLCTVSSGTSGVLFSEALFSSPGDRTVALNDTLNVSYSFSNTASA